MHTEATALPATSGLPAGSALEMDLRAPHSSTEQRLAALETRVMEMQGQSVGKYGLEDNLTLDEAVEWFKGTINAKALFDQAQLGVVHYLNISGKPLSPKTILFKFADLVERRDVIRMKRSL